MASREDERSSSPGRTFDVDQFLNLDGDKAGKAAEVEEVWSALGARTTSEGSEQQIEGSFRDEGTSSRLTVRGRPVTAEIGPSTVSDEFFAVLSSGIFSRRLCSECRCNLRLDASYALFGDIGGLGLYAICKLWLL